MFRKLLTILFILFVICALAVFSIFFCLFYRISLWYAVPVFIGIIIVYFILKWVIKRVRHYYRRRKLGDDEQQGPDDKQLEESFSNALLYTKKYRREHRQKLPWYFLLGALDSGKTSLVSRSRVYSPAENIDPTAEVVPTNTAHCWALDNVVIAETSGGIFNSKPSRLALRAWKKLVWKIRLNKRHINVKGFIVTLSVDQLLGDQDELAQYALNLRQKVEYFSKQAGYSYPVYLVITKADRLQGFESFSFGLPEEIREQAFGQIFGEKDFQLNQKDMVNDWLAKLTGRIRGFNILQLQANNTLLPRVLLFENKIKEIKSSLVSFLNAFFRVRAQSNDDNPVLRGMFLTSAKQDSNLLELDKGSILEGLSVPFRSRAGTQGLFIHGIFSDILPKDYNLQSIFSKKLSARKRYYREAISGWWIVLIGGTIYLGIAYAHTIKALTEIEEVAKIRNDQFSDKLSYNLLLMASMEQDLENIENIRDNWFFSVWPYSITFNDIISGYHQHYVKLFNKYIAADLSQALISSADLVMKPKHKQNFGFVVENIVQRINLIQARLNLMPENNIQSLGLRSLLIDNNFKSNDYGVLYKNYITWNQNLISLKRQRGQLLKLLDSLNLFEQPFSWLRNWINEVSDIQPIKASTYWPENHFPIKTEPKIDSVFTQAGYELIQSLFTDIANVQLQPTEVEQYSLRFFAEYDLNRYDAWEKFTADFRTNVEYIPSEAAWYAIAQLSLLDSPYIFYAKKLRQSFTDTSIIKHPEWLKLFNALYEYYSQSTLVLLAANENTSWWEKLGNYINKYTSSFQTRIDGIQFDQNLLTAINKYQKSILKLQKYVLTLDEEAAFNVVKSIYSNKAKSSGKSSKKGEFYKAYNFFQQIKFFATTDFKLVNRNEATWSLYRGMFDLLLHGANEKAMCYIEQMWKDKVINNYSTSMLNNTFSLKDLFGQKSEINQFMMEYVYPFIMYKSSQGGYVAKSVFGHEFYFSPFIYKYAVDQYQYVKLLMLQKHIETQIKNNSDILEVQIKPTNVNKSAKLLPDSTTLFVVCDGKKQEFENFDMVSNFSLTSDIFKCKSAELRIGFNGASSFSAIKKYSGEDGFLELINDFKNQGQKTFKASDFPSAYSQLQNYNINSLTTFVDFSGINSVRPLLDEYTQKKSALSEKVYKGLTDWKYLNIISCWDDEYWGSYTKTITKDILE